jgi:hypothetical protein
VARGSKNSQTRGALFKKKFPNSRRAVQKMPKIEARSSKQKNIPKPSIGKNLQHLFLLYQQSCTESLREILKMKSLNLKPTNLIIKQKILFFIFLEAK